MSRLTFEVLGPLRALDGAAEVSLGPPAQQAVLAVLLIRSPSLVAAQDLIDAVWGQRPPLTCAGLVRKYISRLRAVVGAETIESVGGGYRIRLRPEQLDLTGFEGAVAEAEQLRRDGALGASAARLREVLALWQGEPLVGLPGPAVGAQRQHLHELHSRALQERFDTELALGLHRELVPELAQAVTQRPFVEPLIRMLMLALYRSGRQAEALAAFDDARRRLADELGVDPTPELRQMHEAILRAEVDDPGGDPSVGHGALLASPRQLPGDIRDFTGRAEELALLGELLSTKADAPSVAGVIGAAGMGKTAIAVRAAHSASSLFRDGQLYADLHGTDAAPVPSTDLLAVFLTSLGVTGSSLPDDTDARAALYRSLLADRSVLVVLDNAHDVTQVHPLLPGSATSAVLVTSRYRLAELPGIQLVPLGKLGSTDVVDLLAAIAGPERVAADPQAARALAATCDGLPLAARIIGSRLASRPSQSLRSFIEVLQRARSRLDELQLGHLAVRAAFDTSYVQLSPAAATALRMMSVLAGPLTSEAAAALLDAAPREVQSLLDELVDASMLEQTEDHLYRYHELLQLFSSEQLSTADRAAMPAALERLASHYIATLRSVNLLTMPENPIIRRWDVTSCPPASLCNADEADVWLHRNWMNVLDLAERVGGAAPRAAADLLELISRFLDEAGYWDRWEQATVALAAAARATGDRAAALAVLSEQAGIAYRRGRYADAEELAEQALARAEEIDCVVTVGNALNLLGNVTLKLDRTQEAIGYYHRSHRWFDTAGLPATAALVRAHLANAELSRQQPERAIALLQDSLAVLSESGSTRCREHLLYFLGKACRVQRKFPEAIKYLDESLAVSLTAGHRHFEALVRKLIADTLIEMGQVDRATEHAKRAFRTFLGVGDIRNAAALRAELPDQLDEPAAPN